MDATTPTGYKYQTTEELNPLPGSTAASLRLMGWTRRRIHDLGEMVPSC